MEKDKQTALVVPQSTAVIHSIEWSQERVQTLKSMIMPGATEAELELFMYVCNRTGLDPFTRQIYAMKKWDESQRREVYSAITSIDGFRLVAERTGKYTGQQGPWWCGPDGKWVDVWLKPTPPVAARVGALRKDFSEPLYAVARWETYARTKKDGSLMKSWAKMSDLMLAKVAEALALRRAFPHDLSGLYTADEMGQVLEKEEGEKETTKSPTEKAKSDVAQAGHKIATGAELKGELIWDGENLYKLSVPREFLGDYRLAFKKSKYYDKPLKDIPVEDLYQLLDWGKKERHAKKGGLRWEAAKELSHVQEYLVEIGELDPGNRLLPLPKLDG